MVRPQISFCLPLLPYFPLNFSSMGYLPVWRLGTPTLMPLDTATNNTRNRDAILVKWRRLSLYAYINLLAYESDTNAPRIWLNLFNQVLAWQIVKEIWRLKVIQLLTSQIETASSKRFFEILKLFPGRILLWEQKDLGRCPKPTWG